MYVESLKKIITWEGKNANDAEWLWEEMELMSDVTYV